MKKIKTEISKTVRNFVKPIEILLGSRPQKGLKDGQTTHKEAKESFQYFPIFDIVKGVLSDRDRFKKIVGETTKTDVYCSDLNGTRIQKLVSEATKDCESNRSTIVIRIILSCDDVELLNATSKKCGIHKTTGIYFSLANLGYPESIKDVYPLIICSALDFKKYGAPAIFKAFFLDLKKINKKGKSMRLHGKNITLKIIRVGDTGDSLGLCELHCFRGTGANVFCRKCLIKRIDFVQNLNHEAPPRTIEEYLNIFQKIQQASTLKQKDEICKEWGLKTECHLNEVPFWYQQEEMNHPFLMETFDTMHDTLEGCSKLIANHVIRFITNKTQLTLTDVNKRIKNFNYGPLSDKDKPLVITAKTLAKEGGRDIGQSAIQTWVLLRILPFIIYDAKVDEDEDDDTDDPVIQQIRDLLGIHLDILSIVFSKFLKPRDVSRLKGLVSEHNSLVQKLFPDAPKLNKFHHLLHYPNSIKLNGPLCLWWTVRYEMFHQFLKKITYVSKNFINLPKTLANRLSFMLSYNLSYKEEEIEPESGIYNSLKFEGVSYQKNSVICYSKPDEQPQFGQIESVSYEKKTKKYELILAKLITIEWDYSLHSFKVQKSRDKVHVELKNLNFKYPFDLWSTSGSGEGEIHQFVSLKYLMNSF